MLDQTTENFLTAMAEVFGNLPPIKKPSYRIYYDEQGCPTLYTTEDLPGNYIEVDGATYINQDRNRRIVDGKIITIRPPVLISKLVPSDSGITCSPDNVCVVVEHDQPNTKWSVKHRETY